MGALLRFTGGVDGSDLPPERAKLVRLNGEIGGLDGELALLRSGKAQLEAELAKTDVAAGALDGGCAFGKPPPHRVAEMLLPARRDVHEAVQMLTGAVFCAFWRAY